MTTHAITPHTRIDNTIIDNLAAKIGIYGLGIYVAIKRHLNQKTGECFPSYKTIARKLGIDRGTVIRYVKKLKAVGLVDPEWRFKEDGGQLSKQNNFDKGSCPKQQPDRCEDNPPGCPEPPKQSEPNIKQRTISDVDFFAENLQTPHATPTTSHKRPQTPMRQRTCPHPPSEIVFLADHVTICHHCYGLLDENLKLQEEEISPVEIVAA